MTSNASLFLALRYLKPKRTFVSVITVISILGVTLGVAALMVVIAVMAGFEEKIRESVLGIEPHIQVQNTTPQDYEPMEGEAIVGWRQIVEIIKEDLSVENASPYLEDFAFMEFNGEPDASAIRGVWMRDESRLEQLADLVAEGEFLLDDESIVVGQDVARRMGMTVGDPVTIYAPGNIRDLVNAVRKLQDLEDDDPARDAFLDEIESGVLPKDVVVAGIFEGNFQFGQLVFLPLYVGQELLGVGDYVDGIAVHTDDPDGAAEIADRIASNLPAYGWYPRTWMQKHGNFFATVQSERSMMYVVLFIIVLVAAFSTMNTMITVTVQKKREIGVITALGARVSQVMWIFLSQGMVVGALGSLCGIGLGWIVLIFRNGIRDFIARVFGIQIFDPSVYGVAEIPMKIQGIDIAIIAGGAFILCALAALPPAFMAARTHPARALRGD